MEPSKIVRLISLLISFSISLIFNCSTVNKGKFLNINLLIFFSNRQYFDVVGDDSDLINDKINATSPYNDGWTQQYYKDKIKTTKINIAVPDHPDYTELDD